MVGGGLGWFWFGLGFDDLEIRAGMLNQGNCPFPGAIVIILCCPGGTSQLIVIM